MAADERDAATSMVNAANAKVQASDLELDMAKNQNEKLIKEVEHLESEVNKLRRREKDRASANKGHRRDASRAKVTPRANDYRASKRTSEVSKPTPRTSDPTKPVMSALTDRAAQHQHKRTDSVIDPRYSVPSAGSALASHIATASAQSSARECDSYIPSLKRARLDSDIPVDLNAGSSIHWRRAVCGSCKKDGKDDSCDGKAECNRCQRYGSWCAYWRCDQRSRCKDATCTYLHLDQWDEEAEGRERKIR